MKVIYIFTFSGGVNTFSDYLIAREGLGFAKLRELAVDKLKRDGGYYPDPGFIDEVWSISKDAIKEVADSQRKAKV